MARVAVTGAGGFVGRHVVPLILDGGHEARALTRTGEMPSTGRGVEYLQGDVRDPSVVRSLVEGCEVVIHLASSFSPVEEVSEIVAVGTRNVVMTAKDVGVTRIVYMSCLGADAASHSPLYSAKWKAEQAVRSSGLTYTVLRPSLVLGQWDGVVKPLAHLVRSLPVVPLPGKGEYRHQPIDVRDLAQCVIRAMHEEALADETVSVGGPMYVTFRQLVDLIATHLGLSKAKLLVPYRWLPYISLMLPSASRTLFQQPRLSQFQHGVVASPGIVQRMFGFEPRSILSQIPEYLA